jgi:serine/threonine protein kinase
MSSGTPSYGSGDSGLRPGTLLDGKYEILGLLGVGGMGEVYKALHVHLNAFRCVKVMKPALFAEDSSRIRFMREARLATQIHHPNVAVVHDFSVMENGLTYMVTEYIDGTTLRQWSAARGRFPLPLAAEVIVQVLAGLDVIHRRGLLHRDISADNIMLSYDLDEHLVAKIIDLGVAKDVSAPSDATQVGMLIGNPRYMSPEQLGELADDEQLDNRADLYCLGVVMYEMLAGVPPFVAKTPSGYIIKHLTQAPPPLSQSVPGHTWPSNLETVLFKALEKDRRRRYADAREFSRAMIVFLEREPGTFTRDDIVRASARFEKTLALTPEEVRSDVLTKKLSDDEAFQAAFEDGSSQAWQHFLDAFPDSQNADRAHDLLAEAASFESAESMTQLRDFLRLFPDSRHELDAEIRLSTLKREAADRAWAEAQAAGTYEAVAAFIQTFPRAHIEEAQQLAEQLRQAAARELVYDAELWGHACEDGTVAALEAYLAEHPNGKWADEARKSIEYLKASLSVTEPRDWDAAWEAGTIAAWDGYLAQHVYSRRAHEARRWRQEAVEFEQAAKMNTPVMWRAFLKAWPSGRHRLDAEVRLRSVS